MDTYDLQQIVETLQNFTLLKKQQLIIHSWIFLKIFVKRKVRRHSTQSQNSSLSFTNRPKDIHHTQPNAVFIDEYDQYVQPPFTHNTSSINYSTHNRFHTDGITAKSQRQNQKKIKQYPVDKSRHYTELQKSVDGHYIPFVVQEQYLVNCQDNDEFEDMILDRLSKLEESISQIMEQRKLHQENSGNIDYQNYQNSLFQNVPHLNFKDHSSEEQSFPDINPPYPIQNGNARFSYNLQSSSLVRDSIQENSYEQQADLNDWKYIPIGKEKEPADNIKKIKNILQNNHVNNEDYMFINDVDDFNQNQIADYQRHSRKKSNYRPQQYTERIYGNGGQRYGLNLDDDYEDNQNDYNMKQKSASFRLNRVQIDQQNYRIQINQYSPHNQIQTENGFNLHNQYQNMASYPSEQSQQQSDLCQNYIKINPNSRADPSDELQRELRNSGQIN